MGPVAKLMRGFAKWQFRVRGLATIPDIPTDEFHALIGTLEADGWKKIHEYRGFDSWIDYGCIRLWRRGTFLKCEWDPYDEGSIAGPQAVVGTIAARCGRSAVAEWRWSVWG